MRKLNSPKAGSGGFSLVEVLITMLVLGIGLLGLAALQTLSLKHNHNALLRTQATVFAYNILDRMRAQQGQISQYGSSLDVTVACDPAFSGSGGTRAEQDLAEWRNLLACHMLDGAGAITIAGNQQVTVTICWNERPHASAIPPDDDDPAHDDANAQSSAIPSLCADQSLMGFAYTTRI